MGQCVSSKSKGQPKTDVAMIGFDGSGKTTLLYKLLRKGAPESIPRTVGYNLEEIKLKKTSINIWDIGGHASIRGLWHYHYSGKNGVIFVVDSSNKEKIDESVYEVEKLLKEPEIRKNRILVVANKQDLEESVPCDIIERKLKQRLNGSFTSIKVIPASTVTDGGLDQLKNELNGFVTKSK